MYIINGMFKIIGSFINSGTTSMSSKTDAYGALIVKGDIPTGNNYVVKLQAGHKLVTKKIIIK